MVLRIGILGTGGMARQHAKHFLAQRGVRLAACHDLDPERAAAFAAEFGVAAVCPTPDDLCVEVDAVAIVAADPAHAPLTRLALEAGRHVLCEKPLTVTLAEARRVARTYTSARKRGCIGMVNFSHRGSHFEFARKLIADGAIGEPRYVHARYLQGWLGGDRALANPSRVWRLQKAKGSGGVLGDLGCHLLDFATGVVGVVRRLRCTFRVHSKTAPDGSRVARWPGGALNANDSVAIECDFADGAFGTAETSRWATGCQNEVDLAVHGTGGAVILGHSNPAEPWLRHCRLNRSGVATWKDRVLPRHVDNWRRLVRAIRRGEPEQPDLYRGAEIQSLLDACERSAASGKWERPRKHR